MLDQTVGNDVIAAHEAGHVVIALHLGMTPLSVRLVPQGTSPAGTCFEPSELAEVPHEHRALLAFSGLAGQLFAPTAWEPAHVEGDRRWLLLDWDSREDRAQGGAIELLRDYEGKFDSVRGAIEAGLAGGAWFLSLAELLMSA